MVNMTYSPGTVLSITNTSQKIAIKHTSRKMLMIQNNSVLDFYVSFGVPATLTNSIKIPQGATWDPRVVPIDAVHIIASAPGPGAGVMFIG